MIAHSRPAGSLPAGEVSDRLTVVVPPGGADPGDKFKVVVCAMAHGGSIAKAQERATAQTTACPRADLGTSAENPRDLACFTLQMKPKAFKATDGA